jgi:hypothetical protein
VVSNIVIDYEIDISDDSNTVIHKEENNSNYMIILQQTMDEFFQNKWVSIHHFIYNDGSTIPINILLDFTESIGARENMKNATRTKK